LNHSCTARDGQSAAGMMEAGAHEMARDRLMERGAEMIKDVQAKAAFPDGTKPVIFHEPIR